MTIQKLMKEDLPAILVKNADSAKEIGAKFHLVLGEAGEWVIDMSVPSVTEGSVGDPDVKITLPSEDFERFYASPQEVGLQLFFSGRLKVEGNQMLALKLSKFLTVK